ncbi:MAG: protein-glutamate O-methyltransferase CheR [Chromatiales bacterium]|nr:protein-glutamate O-methyltransferase CheR [Chromatiales bacterium]
MERAREFEYTRRDFDALRRISNAHTGIIVGDDKFDMFYSRLSKRLRVYGLRTFAEYVTFLNENPDQEFEQFINSITTNLTSFFRENHHFEFLRHQLLPELVRKNFSSRRIRIWSAGCSTGEEPYSIAMTLKEALVAHRDWDVKVLATDIDSNVLNTAAAGIYPLERASGLSRERLKRWFRKGKGEQTQRVRVHPELREMISFRPLNLMGEWPMKGPFDAIFCRNVLIYFDADTKERLVQRFTELLPPGGHLFVGHSESLSKVSAGIKLIGNTVYTKQG